MLGNSGVVTPYLWSDLMARRNSLSLRVEELAELLRVGLSKYMSRETGALEAGAHLVEELIAMEEFVAVEVERLVAEAPAAGVVVCQVFADQAAFEDAHPEARTRRKHVPYPVSLHHVAVGRAVGQLTRQGREVQVYRGERRADLLVRRLANGLLKEETARLLGLESRKYGKYERGSVPPPEGLVAELQAIDDFIADTAGKLEVTEIDGVGVVVILDDQDVFEATYPQAKTKRHATVFPRRVHRVAAGRRAHELESAGRPVRIAVVDET